VQRLRRHPLARALRVDKLTLAALEATLLGPTPPVVAALSATGLLERATRIARAVGGHAVESVGVVGGGGAPGVELPSAAVALAPALARRSGWVPCRSWGGSRTTGCCSTCWRWTLPTTTP
jgi:L-seryl-tRNA(Ser) seleniumtransferase